MFRHQMLNQFKLATQTPSGQPVIAKNNHTLAKNIASRKQFLAQHQRQERANLKTKVNEEMNLRKERPQSLTML